MNLKELQDRIQARQANKTEEEILGEDEYILMAGYLSEIERFQKQNKFSRKDLAAKIKTSASYLTQVFKGDKPLNFYTIAKIQRALKIRFKVIAIPLQQEHAYIIPSTAIKENLIHSISKTKLEVSGTTFSLNVVQKRSDEVQNSIWTR
jgi:transcriptional regulator with XRE-family HTH domain